MNALLLDIRFALRSLSRTPTFTMVAIVTLALGIGANTAIFSLVNAVLLRPLPYHEPERLVNVRESARGNDHRNVSAHEFAAWRDQSTVLQDIMLYEGDGFNLTGSGEPRSVRALSVSANYFRVLGIRAKLGRTFGDGDDRAGKNQLVILSEALWKGRFASDSSVIGRSVRLNDQPYTVVGVMQTRAFDPDLWVPMDLESVLIKVGKHSLTTVARLKPGVTRDQARTDLNRVSKVLAQQMPNENAGHLAAPYFLTDELLGSARRPAFIALGAVVFVLLIACANVAHLLLTRAANRQREIALRTALGASRSRLVRHLLTESLLLAGAGGLGGLLIASWIIELVPHLSATNMPRIEEITIDRWVLAATAFFALGAGVISGLVPALRGTVPRIGELLSEGTRATTGSARRLAGILVVSEVALALVLLVGAGLAVKTLTNLGAVKAGFDSSNVLLVGVSLPATRYPKPEQQRAAFDAIASTISTLPGVVSVGTTTQLPLSGEDDWIQVSIEGHPVEGSAEQPSVAWRVVNTDYFKAMRIPIRSGRTFQQSDARISVPVIRWYPQQSFPAHFNEPQSAPVAVINETMAKRNWPNENPIGKRFKIIESPYFTVIGVVGDVKHRALGLAASPEAYLSNLQEPEQWSTFTIRSTGDPLALAPSVRARLRAFDKDLPVERIRTMEQVRSESVGDAQLNATLFGAFGVLALVMSVVGIYGVISYSVVQRTHEIGIRTAIGASSRDVIRLVLGRALTLTTVGVAVGLAAALALTRVLERLLFDVKPSDPATLIAMATLLAAVAMLASYIPARRAMRVDPLEALRAP